MVDRGGMCVGGGIAFRREVSEIGRTERRKTENWEVLMKSVN